MAERKLIAGFGIACGLGVAALAAGFSGMPTAATILAAAQLVTVGWLVLWTSRHLLHPLKEMVQAVGEMRDGRRAKLPPSENDDLDDLSRGINEMCDAHQAARQADRQQLLRTESAAQAVFNSLPHGVALISPQGTVELCNTRAAALGLIRARSLDEIPQARLKAIVDNALNNCPPHVHQEGAGEEGVIRLIEDGTERRFMPHAAPLRNHTSELIGVSLVLVDVTASSRVDEVKSNVLSAFSHELKTPMTSLQMSLHLLREDASMRLTTRQMDLLSTACEETDRLQRLVEKILCAARDKW